MKNPVQRLEHIGGLRVPESEMRVTIGTPLISIDYYEILPSCTAIAIMSDDYTCALSHIKPYINISSAPEKTLNYVSRRKCPQDQLSVIIAGTDPYYVPGIAKYFIRKGIRTQAILLHPNPQGMIDMGIDPENRTFLIYRHFSDQTQQISF